MTLVAAIGAGALTNLTRSTTGDSAARQPWLRWVLIGAHHHLVPVAWLMGWPLSSALAVWAWTVGATAPVNLLAGRPAQRLAGGAAFGGALLAPRVWSMPAAMPAVAGLFTFNVAFAFAASHDAPPPAAATS
ncbi:MAG: hypothetical protein INH41_01255 [Myxococcaceae bacterium]|nr:hypothetical protein [Myxococcaceae bacterium]MCA3011005.1 hypothetical protein [Myxococcaceae bacterium]